RGCIDEGEEGENAEEHQWTREEQFLASAAVGSTDDHEQRENHRRNDGGDHDERVTVEHLVQLLDAFREAVMDLDQLEEVVAQGLVRLIRVVALDRSDLLIVVDELVVGRVDEEREDEEGDAPAEDAVETRELDDDEQTTV
ncbi:hypothetical protein PFISCL1PPCAC_13798, partial [Pristionchus fissidentatus]